MTTKKRMIRVGKVTEKNIEKALACIAHVTEDTPKKRVVVSNCMSVETTTTKVTLVRKDHRSLSINIVSDTQEELEALAGFVSTFLATYK